MLSSHIYFVLQKKMQDLIKKASYIVVICDESTAINECTAIDTF